MVGVRDLNLNQRPRLRRRTLIGAVGATFGALSLAVSGCSTLTPPQPDPVIDHMLALSLRDADLLEGQPAESRDTQAQALEEEVARECGTHRDGSAPEECLALPAPAEDITPDGDVELSHQAQLLLNSLDPSDSMYDAMDSRDALREEYPAFLASSVTGGIVLAAREVGVTWNDLTPQFPEGTDVNSSDADLLAQALDAEYALIYGMGVAAPRVPAELSESTATSADRHRAVRDEVVRVLGVSGVDVPVPAPGYSGSVDGHDVDEDPAAFATALERSAAGSWRTVLLEAKSPQVRQFALQAAGLSEAGASIFSGSPTAAMPGFDDTVSPAPAEDGN